MATVKQLKAELDEAGIEYHATANKKALETLLATLKEDVAAEDDGTQTVPEEMQAPTGQPKQGTEDLKFNGRGIIRVTDVVVNRKDYKKVVVADEKGQEEFLVSPEDYKKAIA